MIIRGEGLIVLVAHKQPLPFGEEDVCQSREAHLISKNIADVQLALELLVDLPLCSFFLLIEQAEKGPFKHGRFWPILNFLSLKSHILYKIS